MSGPIGAGEFHARLIEPGRGEELQLGRCAPCRMAFRWPVKARHRLMEAYCPHCGRKLTQTSHLLKRNVAWLTIAKPLGPGAGKRLQRGERP